MLANYTISFLNFCPISSWAWQHSAAHRRPSCQKTGHCREASKACLISAVHFS
jgi:hypothetical protein